MGNVVVAHHGEEGESDIIHSRVYEIAQGINVHDIQDLSRVVGVSDFDLLVVLFGIIYFGAADTLVKVYVILSLCVRDVTRCA